MSCVSKKHETLNDVLDEWCKREGINDIGIARRLRVTDETIGNWRRFESAPNWLKWPDIARCASRSVADIAIAIAHGALTVTKSRNGSTDSSKILPRTAGAYTGKK